MEVKGVRKRVFKCHLQAASYTGSLDRMYHRKLRETNLELIWMPDPALLGCCLGSLNACTLLLPHLSTLHFEQLIWLYTNKNQHSCNDAFRFASLFFCLFQCKIHFDHPAILARHLGLECHVVWCCHSGRREKRDGRDARRSRVVPPDKN